MIVPYLLVGTSAFLTVLIYSISLLKKSFREADRASEDLTRLHDLTSALLKLQNFGIHSVPLPRLVMDLFELEYCAIYLPSENSRWHRFSASLEEPFRIELLHLDALIEEYETGVRYQVIKNESKTMAIVAVKPGSVSWQTIETIANILAFALEHSLYRNGLTNG